MVDGNDRVCGEIRSQGLWAGEDALLRPGVGAKKAGVSTTEIILYNNIRHKRASRYLVEDSSSFFGKVIVTPLLSGEMPYRDM